MAQINEDTVLELLDNKPFRILPAGKQLTLALGGLYFASTTLAAKPQLVWENEKSYPRYYIPISSLHEDVQSSLTGTSGSSSVIVKTAQTINSRSDPDSHAVIEQLTVGPKSTAWVRFTGGVLKDHIRYEANELDGWFEDGKIAKGIKNPYKRIDTAAVSHHIVVKVDGEVVAETNVAVALYETNLSETYYLPATSIKDWGSIERSDLRTACPYKGEAWYLTITVKGKKYENLIWYYQYPTHESAGIEGLISFYRKDFVEVLVDGSPL